MFDFLKDIILEVNGIDSEAVKEEEKIAQEKKKKDRFIFSKKMKIFIFIFGIIYLLLAGFNIATIKAVGGLNLYIGMRFIVLILMDVSCMVCLVIGKKQTEIAALILIIIFILTQYFSIFLMM